MRTYTANVFFPGCLGPLKREVVVPEEMDIEAAAKTLSGMDYPWDHMPDKGRNAMREHAKSVIEAAFK
ncbi:hypothetical protein D3C77_451960 [compost metagenome]